MTEMKNKNNHWHALEEGQVLSRLKSASGGLSSEEARKRLLKWGANKLPAPKRLSCLSIFLSQFRSSLIYILIFAGGITLFLKEYWDTAVIGGAIILNVMIGFFQENKASRALERLRKAIHFKARVWREGHYQEIEAEEVVPGDIILLKPGDKVPADGRILKSNNLEINEASLTGEWVPARKKAKLLPSETPLADRDNMVYQGTSVAGGSGQAVVVRTGRATELGKIALLVRETIKEASPLKQKVARFAWILGLFFILISAALVGVGYFRGMPFAEVLILAAALAVAAVPEGLPVAVTVILALGMKRILDKRGLVRKLIAAETLGSTSVICTDKTGTLTEAKMAVSKIIASSEKIALQNAVLAADGFIENPRAVSQDWIIRAGPTDKALIRAAAEKGINKAELDEKYPIIQDLPFNQTNNYLAKLREVNQKDKVLYVSGAPEVILARSEQILENNQEKKISAKKRIELFQIYNDLARQGLRVIGTAYRKIRTPPKFLEDKIENYCQHLVFVGFVGLGDPLRPDIKETIKVCLAAGLKPIIVTGDHKLTAQVIAQKLGLPYQEKNILEGRDLENLSDQDLRNKLQDISIYARVSPKDKLRIIDAWQNKGAVVAMTGDGVNDAPALTAADIGVALGSGTDVAREVSDLVLLDDNFSIIVAAIREGRAILDNIKKVIVYLLSDSFGEIILVGASFFLGLPLPLLPLQILWINLVEDGLPGMALAFERPESLLMQKKPLPRQAPLLDRQMKALIFIIGLSVDFILLASFWLLFHYSALDLVHIRTIIFAAFSLNSLLYVFSCRSFQRPLWRLNPLGNKYLLGASFGGLMLVLVAIYIPFFQNLLDTTSLNLKNWLLVGVLSIVDIIAIEAFKYFFIIRRKNNLKIK